MFFNAKIMLFYAYIHDKYKSKLLVKENAPGRALISYIIIVNIIWLSLTTAVIFPL